MLFPRSVRAATNSTQLDDLTRQHASSRPHLEALKNLLGRMEAEIPGAAQEFSAKVTTYAVFNYRHMAQEEAEVLPRACEILGTQDWDEIALAFAANKDPLPAWVTEQRVVPPVQWPAFVMAIVTSPLGMGSRILRPVAPRRHEA